MDPKFNILFENLLERYQQGGYLIGDRVRFRNDALRHEFFKDKAASFVELVKSCSNENFDLNLRISSLKSVYPTTTQNYRGGTESPDKIFADIIVEYAPGLYRTPMTVPIEVLELMEDGINRGPVPNSLKRKSDIHGPKEIKTKETNDLKAEVNLKNTNVKLPGGNKWDDSKPGGGNKPKKKR
jgi:hypothetical protein